MQFVTGKASLGAGHQTTVPSNYMRQLDALRAFAVLGVWVTHWELGKASIFHSVRWGELGVQLFFVLSGFLITGILLRSRDNIEAGEARWDAAKRFYIRRSLRIFPIYYLTLFATAIVIQHMREGFWWHLTYTSNVFFAIRGKLDLAGAHFWTLSVEEQFYLVWPCLLLTISRRMILPSIVAMVAGGVIFRTSSLMLGYDGLGLVVLPFGCIDQLGFGALLAYVTWIRSNPQRECLLKWGLWLGIPATALSIVLGPVIGPDSRLILGPFMAALAFTWLIGRAANGFGGPLGAILNSGPLVFLGRISYGLYIYHPFVSWAINRGAVHADLSLPNSDWARFALYAFATIALSTLSWYLIEKPLKDRKKAEPK